MAMENRCQSRLTPARIVFILALSAVIVCLAYLTHRRNSDYRTIKTLWTSAVRVDAENPRAYLSLGVAALRENRLADAEQALTRSIELSHTGRDTSPEALLNLGYVYFSRGNPSKALEQFESLLRMNPDHTQALYNASVTALQAIADREERLERARSYQARLESILSPNHPRVLALNAIVTNETHGPDAAAKILENYGKGALLDPAIQEAWEEILVRFRFREADERQSLTRLLEEVPAASVVIRSVHRLANSGNHRNAILLTGQAYRIRPDFGPSLASDPVTSAFLSSDR